MALVFGLSCVASAVGQGRVYVVDEDMGPGADYPDIPAAVAKAVDGDRIVVRKGSYSGFVLGRAVTILGQDGATIARKGSGALGWLDIHSIAPGRKAVLQNLTFPVDPGAPSFLIMHHCHGRVILERLRSGTLFVWCWSMQQVHLSHCNIAGITGTGVRATLLHCNLNQADMKLDRQDSCRFAESSEVVLAGCNVTGFPFFGVAQPAIALQGGSRLTITGDGSEKIQPCSCNSRPGLVDVLAATTNDVIVADPRIKATFGTLSGKPNVVRRTVPYLDAKGAPLGGTVNVALRAGNGDTYYLAIGLPGGGVPMPALGGTVWLDLRTAVLVGGGVLDASGVVRLSVPVPNDVALFGLGLVWQGVAGSTVSGPWLSNAAAYVHGF